MASMRSDIRIREVAPSESAIILHHRRSMFRDMGEGTPEELDRMVEVAEPWLAQALAEGRTGIGSRWMPWAASRAAVECY